MVTIFLLMSLLAWVLLFAAGAHDEHIDHEHRDVEAGDRHAGIRLLPVMSQKTWMHIRCSPIFFRDCKELAGKFVYVHEDGRREVLKI